MAAVAVRGTAEAYGHRQTHDVGRASGEFVSSPSYGAPTSPAVSASNGQLANQQASKVLGDAIAQVQRVIVGQEHMVEQLMVGLLAKGHIQIGRASCRERV